ncbi:MAG TPA: NrfD/PsrC family molybdoenzyme membrane anchor subunit [Anaeromyxobacteraceae bacterium]|nr:NrfD/PsrC family molybdoenzyme membrane anchor subunit [Anaeromyxobacteraceae bacterium]
MLEKALTGGRRYFALLGVLGALAALGLVNYLHQLQAGLGVTGLSRDVPWGLYISQFTFLVGVAASAVMVVLPYYVHHYKVFGPLAILGEFLAIAAVVMCLLFIFVDMGQPRRVVNVILYPTPHSVMFWDMMVLNGYLVLNVVISRATFRAERAGTPPPRWVKPVVYLSIPWAVSIHTVTAFLYSGLAARPFWLTAILAPRFLASAFASGPALLILLALLVRRVSRFDPGEEAIRKLGEIVAYAMAVNVFFVALELFTALYSDIPAHVEHFTYLYAGLHEHHVLAPWMWASLALAGVSLVLLLVPRFRRDRTLLVLASVAVVGSLWIDKGLGMVVTGFVPSPLGHVTEYWPTAREATIALGVYAVGALILTVLYKIAITVREELALDAAPEAPPAAARKVA